MIITLCASLMTSPIRCKQDQTNSSTEQQRSFVSRAISNTYNTLEDDVISILMLIKNNPVKSFLAVAAFMIIIGSIEGAIWRAQSATYRDIRFEIDYAFQRIKDIEKTNLQKILDKLQMCYKRSS